MMFTSGTFCLLVVISGIHGSLAARNCLELRQADASIPSGAYSVTNSAGQSIRVYCQFYSHYVLTFISRHNTAAVDFNALRDVTNQVVIRHKRANGAQYTATMKQLNSFAQEPVSVQWNAYSGFQRPQNYAMTPYIYVGFIPARYTYRGAVQGWQCNGREYTFSNCDANPNSYIAFLFNTVGRGYTSYVGGKNTLMYPWYDAATTVSASEHLPAEFLTPYHEIHKGGCGGYSRGSNVPDIIGSNIGVMLKLTCSVPPNAQQATKSYTGTALGNTVTYTCSSGYTVLSGSQTRTCTGGGWSGSPPVCGVHGNWATWSSWTGCSVTCGTGTWSRSRTCTNPAPVNGNTCTGSATESGSCSPVPCPIDGGWTAWSSYGSCTVTCGGGGMTRTRTCTSPAPAHGGQVCAGSGSETATCGTSPCPIDGGWSNWSAWPSCSRTCGGQTLARSRSCNSPVPQYNGADCVGLAQESQRCATNPCPIDGGFTAWTAWVACSVTCGGGSTSRSRTCTNPVPAHGGANCTGPTDETTTCNTHNCPIDGDWTNWSAWDTCTVTCGGGTSVKTRTCTNPAPQYNGADCVGSASESQSCSTQNCPIDGGFTAWTAWVACSVTCGGGSTSRSRTCTNPVPAHGGANCTGPTDETTTCNTHNCPIDGDWTNWSAWDTCTVTCGGGTSVKTRTCTNPAPQYNGADCVGSASESQSCSTQNCPIDGGWGSWSAYEPCSVTCLGGWQNRTRSCDTPAPAYGGADCPGDDWEDRFCNDNPCNVIPPVDGEWGAWQTWQGCSVTCGSGVQRRYRACDNPSPAHGGLPCLGDAFEENACSGGSACPVVTDGNWGTWSAWSGCSASCGPGRALRSRVCDNPVPSSGGRQCTGDSMELEACTIQSCTSGNNTGGYVNVCPVGFFTCRSGQVTCIQHLFTCDCTGDCYDNSDEDESWAGCLVQCAGATGVRASLLLMLAALLFTGVRRAA